MKYIVQWTLTPATQPTSVSRFLKTGALPPQGVNMLGRWHGMDGSGVAIVESDNPAAMYQWAVQWGDVMILKVTPCVEDSVAGQAMAALARANA